MVMTIPDIRIIDIRYTFGAMSKIKASAGIACI